MRAEVDRPEGRLAVWRVEQVHVLRQLHQDLCLVRGTTRRVDGREAQLPLRECKQIVARMALSQVVIQPVLALVDGRRQVRDLNVGAPPLQEPLETDERSMHLE